MENNNMENNINNGNVNPNGSNGMSVAALVCGILGIVGSFIPYVSYVTLPLAILGIIFGVLGRKKSTNKGLATAGRRPCIGNHRLCFQRYRCNLRGMRNHCRRFFGIYDLIFHVCINSKTTFAFDRCKCRFFP